MTKAIKVTGVLAIILALIGAVCLGVYTYSGAYAANVEDVTGRSINNYLNVSYMSYYAKGLLPNVQTNKEIPLFDFGDHPTEENVIEVYGDGEFTEDLVWLRATDNTGTKLEVHSTNYTNTTAEYKATMPSFTIPQTATSINLEVEYIFDQPITITNTNKSYYIAYNTDTNAFLRIQSDDTIICKVTQYYTNGLSDTIDYAQSTQSETYYFKKSSGAIGGINAIGNGQLSKVKFSVRIPLNTGSTGYITPYCWGFGEVLGEPTGNDIRPSMSYNYYKWLYGDIITTGITQEQLNEAVQNAELRGYQNGLSIANSGSWLSLFTAVFDAPVNTLFGTYNSTTGTREGGLFNLTLPLGETTLDLQGFFMGIVSIIVLLCVVRLILRFIK